MGRSETAILLRSYVELTFFLLRHLRKNAAFGKTVTFGKIDNRSIKEQRESLPIFAQRDDFINAVKLHQVIVAIGETGSGKTTQMAQYLAESGLLNKGIISCTQPRRVAAQSI